MKTKSKSKFLTLLEKGSYYNPANKHYDSKGVVDCDRCKRKNIKMCIGDSKNDLCMNCVHDIEEQLSSQSESDTESESDYEMRPTKMKQKAFSKLSVVPKLTKMKQKHYSSSDSESDAEPRVTKMKQKHYSSSSDSEEEPVKKVAPKKYKNARKAMKNSSYRKKTKTKTKTKKPPIKTKMIQKHYKKKTK